MISFLVFKTKISAMKYRIDIFPFFCGVFCHAMNRSIRTLMARLHRKSNTKTSNEVHLQVATLFQETVSYIYAYIQNYQKNSNRI